MARRISAVGRGTVSERKSAVPSGKALATRSVSAGPPRELWQRVSLPDWQHSPNPLSMLQAVSGEVWEALEDNDSFADLYNEVISTFDDYLATEDTWYARTHPDTLPNGVAYLCTEHGGHPTLPFYAGGLGVLAGDHAKAASDLGVPMVAIGLLYRLGYFHQEVDPEGTQP